MTHLNSTSLICYETSFTIKNHPTKLLYFVALFIVIVCGMIRCLHFAEQSQIIQHQEILKANALHYNIMHVANAFLLCKATVHSICNEDMQHKQWQLRQNLKI